MSQKDPAAEFATSSGTDDAIFFRQLSTGKLARISFFGFAHGSVQPVNSVIGNVAGTNTVPTPDQGIFFWASLRTTGQGYGNMQNAVTGYNSKSLDIAPDTAPKGTRPDPPVASTD
jgi:hypothetical protein